MAMAAAAPGARRAIHSSMLTGRSAPPAAQGCSPCQDHHEWPSLVCRALSSSLMDSSSTMA